MTTKRDGAVRVRTLCAKIYNSVYDKASLRKKRACKNQEIYARIDGNITLVEGDTV